MRTTKIAEKGRSNLSPDPAKLQLIIPRKKDRGFEEVVVLLEEKANIRFDVSSMSKGFISTSNPRFEIGLFSPVDIPFLVERGLSLGITGLDMIKDARAKVKLLLPLGIGKARVVLAGCKEEVYTFPRDLKQRTIYTALPNLTEDFLKTNKLSVKEIKTAKGNLEQILRCMERRDLIVDQTVSGNSLGYFQLVELLEIMKTEYYLFANMQKYQEYKSEIDAFVFLLEAGINAKDKYYVCFNVPPSAQKRIDELFSTRRISCELSPTITSLESGGKAYGILISANKLADTMYTLAECGARDIFSLPVTHFTEGGLS